MLASCCKATLLLVLWLQRAKVLWRAWAVAQERQGMGPYCPFSFPWAPWGGMGVGT